jgi:hypothetical protein
MKLSKLISVALLLTSLSSFAQISNGDGPGNNYLAETISNSKEISEAALLYNWGNSGARNRQITVNAKFICDKHFSQSFGKSNFRNQFKTYLETNFGFGSKFASSLSEKVTLFTITEKVMTISETNGLEYKIKRCPTVEELEKLLLNL